MVTFDELGRIELPEDNLIVREEKKFEQSLRVCKSCGNTFEFLGKYDPGNPSHDLCDDCLLNLPLDPNQKYPEKSVQLMGDDTVAFVEDNQ